MSLLNNRSGPNFLETGGGAEREATGRRAAASAGGTKLRIRSLRPDSSTASTASSRVNQRVSRSCRSGHCPRSEEHTSELQSLMRSSYAVFCLKKKNI